jgi:hypothetical protein
MIAALFPRQPSTAERFVAFDQTLWQMHGVTLLLTQQIEQATCPYMAKLTIL